MTIPAAYRPTPIPPLDGNVPICDPQTGLATVPFLLAYGKLRDYVNGGSRIIPCSASTTSNKITLTPNDAAPLIEGYRDYDVFAFTADATTDGSVTATVVPKTGTLATLKVYKTNGAAQAGSGEIISASTYLAIFADNLDSNAGGLIVVNI
jgi:hypothetical protein